MKYVINPIRYKYNGLYYFQVEYDRSIKMKQVVLIERLLEIEPFDITHLQIEMEKFHILNCQCEIRKLIECNVLLEQDESENILMNILTGLYETLAYKKVEYISSIFPFSKLYLFDAIVAVKAAIHLKKVFVIKRGKDGNIAIHFQNGYVFDTSSRHDIFGESDESIAIVRSKHMCSKILSENGVRVPKQAIVTEYEKGREDEILNHLKYPVCYKPDNMSDGIGVYVNIPDNKTLHAIIESENTRFQRYVVEEYITGNLYRAYYCDGKIVAMIQKGIWYVTGNGEDTIAELIFRDGLRNANELKRLLKYCGLSADTVIPCGQKVILSKAYSSFLKVVEKYDSCCLTLMCQISAIVKMNIFAVDMISKDILDIRKSPVFVLEVQDNPAFTMDNPCKDAFFEAAIDYCSQLQLDDD